VIISDEAVEAAAKAIYESESYQNRWDWPLSEFDREEYRKHARAALEAAAPYLQQEPSAASVWDEAVTVLYMGNAIGPQEMQAMSARNPYRSQA
jgi:hypothetical protein